MAESLKEFYQSLGLDIYSVIMLLFLGIITAALAGWLIFYIIRHWKQKDDDHDTVKKSWHIDSEKPPPFGGKIIEFLLRNGFFGKLGPINESMVELIESLKSGYSRWKSRYQHPWFILLSPNKESNVFEAIYPLKVRNEEESVGLSWAINSNAVILKPSPPREGSRGYFDLFLKILAIYRPKRPCDGIIISISCKNFEEKHLKDLKKWKEALFLQLEDIKTYIRMRLPVYVIIEDSELIEGFSEVSSLVNDKMKQRIFGWSNPMSLDTKFSSSMLDEAIQSICENLKGAGIHYSAHGTEKMVESLITLESEVIKLKNPVIDSLTKGLSQEISIFRGIYFIGQLRKDVKQMIDANQLNPDVLLASEVVEFEEQEDEINPIVNSDVQNVWSYDLFFCKIFAEEGIAYPLSYSIPRNQFMQRWGLPFMAISSFITLFGTANAFYHLWTARGIVKPIIMSINHQLDSATNCQKDTDTLRLNSEWLKNNIHRIPLDSFISFFIPASWDGKVYVTLKKCLEGSVEGFSLASQYNMLLRMGENLKFLPEYYSQVIDENAAMKMLEEYVQKVVTFEKQYKEYLEDIQDQERGKELINDVLDHSVGKLIYRNFELGIYRAIVENNVKRLYQKTMENIFNTSALTTSKELQAQLDHFFKKSQNGVLTIQEIHDLYDYLAKALPLMDSPRFDFWDEDSFNPSERLASIFVAMQETSLLGANLAKSLTLTTSVYYRNFKEQLAGFKSPLVGNIWQKAGSRLISAPSQELMALYESLKSFFDEKWMVTVDPKAVELYTDEHYNLIWDEEILKKANNIMDAWQDFVDSKLMSYPPKVGDIIRTSGIKHVEKVLMHILAHSTKFNAIDETLTETEEIVKTEADNIQKTSPIINRALEVLDDDAAAVNKFRTIVSRHIMKVLQRMDELFTGQEAYRSYDWELWDDKSKNPVNIEIFSAADQDDLASTLESQRHNMERLVYSIAKPLINIMTKGGFNWDNQGSFLINKWAKIIEQFDMHRDKKNKNNITALEKFILEDLAELKSDDCESYTPEPISSNSDYFRQTKAKITQGFAERCAKLGLKKGLADYEKLVESFNNDLSGKFPFVDWADPNVDLGKEATKSDVEEFYNNYKDNLDSIKSSLDDNLEESNAKQKVITFLENLMESMKFLKAVFSNNDNKVNFKVHLKVLDNLTSSYRYLSEWNLTDFNHKTHDWSWSQGSPMEMSWRFTNAYPVTLVQDPNNPYLWIKSKTAGITYQGEWSLLKMIFRHRLTSHDGIAFKDNDILRFVVPNSKGGRELLFMKLKYIGDDDNAVMPEFPPAAPSIFTVNDKKKK